MNCVSRAKWLLTATRHAGVLSWTAPSYEGDGTDDDQVRTVVLILDRWTRSCAPLPRRYSRLPPDILRPPPSARYGNSPATITCTPRSSSARLGIWRLSWSVMTSPGARLLMLSLRRWDDSSAVQCRLRPARQRPRLVRTGPEGYPGRHPAAPRCLRTVLTRRRPGRAGRNHPDRLLARPVDERLHRSPPPVGPSVLDVTSGRDDDPGERGGAARRF